MSPMKSNPHWGNSAPVAGISPDTFSARFTGQVEPVGPGAAGKMNVDDGQCVLPLSEEEAGCFGVPGTIDGKAMPFEVLA